MLKSVLFVSLAFMIAGCQEPPPKLITASGKVLVDGEPLSDGTIRFVPAEGRPMSSAILDDGSFQLGTNSVGDLDGSDGVPPGKYKVAVSSSIIEDEESDKIRWLAPRHYADFRTSGIEIDLQESKDDLLIELTWECAEVASGETEVDEQDAADSLQQASNEDEVREEDDSDAAGDEVNTDVSREQDATSTEPGHSSADDQPKEQ